MFIERKTCVKRYQKVEDILSLAERFHKEVAEACRKLAEQSGAEEVKMFAAFLDRRKRQFEEGLKKFKTQGDENLRETRVQYVAENELLANRNRTLGPEMTLDDVVSVVMAWNSRLEAFYRETANDATLPPPHREMFAQLAEQEGKEKANLKATAERLKKT